jgi:hypothetical protein
MERYIHTDIQSDMGFFFLRMRLLASPFGLAKMFITNLKYLFTIFHLQIRSQYVY